MLRNKEIRQFAVIFAILSIITVISGFLIHSAAGLLSIISCTAFALLFIVFTRMRYRRITAISEQIDLVLHGMDEVYISQAEEGELAILQSEITKMTLRIRDQNEALRREKKHLADSLADITHQLRTPLTSANLILTLLEKNPDHSERNRLLRETEELFAQMEWLINSLLKCSRLDAGIVAFQMTSISVSDLIHSAIHPLQITMELHNITLRTQIPEDLVLTGDKDWLLEALQNIFKNCIQNTGDHSHLEIICQDNPLFCEIVIHDDGPGFAPQDLPHLFDRFYRGKQDSASGYGIGLSLCKSIILKHNGTITAKNHPDGGALFCIRFPK